MTTDTQQKLYVHDPASLLPHLRAHIPHSINVIGALLASGSPPVYATFPPKEEPPNQWVAVVAIPCGQLYLFHTALATGIEADREAEADVVASVQEAQRLHPTHHRVGGLPIQWAAAVRGVVGGEDRGVTGIYVAGDAAMRTCDAVSREEDVRALEGMGLVMDAGMPGDEDIVSCSQPVLRLTLISSRPPTGCILGNTTRLAGRGDTSPPSAPAVPLPPRNPSHGS
jgi:hypothetical protein